MSRNAPEIDPKSTETNTFGGFVFLTKSRELRTVEGKAVDLRSQSSEVLSVLAARPGEIVSKDALMRAVWPDTFVTDDSLTQCIADIRRALGDDRHVIVETLPKRGYRLNADRAEAADPGAAAGTERAEAARAANPFLAFAKPMADKPSIAVLPFVVMGSDPEQEFFADGLVEDILTTLSKLSGLSVIARNSSFVYKGRAVDFRQVARELGVRFVLEGSVRKTANRIRITTQLIDATTGIHIWADRFDRSLEDMFAVQDEITLILATEMQVKLTEGEQARLRYTTTTNVETWSLWIEGLKHHRGSMTLQAHIQCRHCWEKALALDPGSAPLNAMLGFSLFSDARHGWTGEDREAALKKAEAYIARALEIDPQNPDAHRALSGVLLLKSRFEEAAAAARKAVKFGPSMSDVLVFGAFVLCCSGGAREAVYQIEKAIALSPNYPAWFLGVLGNASRLSGCSDEAEVAFLAYHEREPGYGLADIVMIQEQAGHLDKARRTAIQLAERRPTFTVASYLRTQFRRDTDQLAADVASLRAAGVPEQ